ncbi:MAG: hypothetical protein AVDCRST_MAG87-3843, partial [uncultured Thermomicrobiales bacterium]
WYGGARYPTYARRPMMSMWCRRHAPRRCQHLGSSPNCSRS